jgi:predicted nucleic acid-binding protein
LSAGILSGSLALDTGVIIEMLSSSEMGKLVTEAVATESIEPHSSEVNLAEAEYILCRKLGAETAKSKLDDLRDSNYVLIADTERVSRIAAEVKCSRTIALANCYTLATAKLTRCKALFAYHETELEREMKKRPYNLELTFLEDLMKKT